MLGPLQVWFSFTLIPSPAVENVEGQTHKVLGPGLWCWEWQRWDGRPHVSSSKAVSVTPPCPSGPILLKNGSAVGDP